MKVIKQVILKFVNLLQIRDSAKSQMEIEKSYLGWLFVKVLFLVNIWQLCVFDFAA